MSGSDDLHTIEDVAKGLLATGGHGEHLQASRLETIADLDHT